jgi:WD40 repeat protein
MLHDNLRVGVYPSDDFEDPFEDTWATYDPDRFGEFFPDGGGSLRGRVSENGRYLACWRECEKNRRGETYPAGICLAENGVIVRVSELADVEVAAPANDGTAAVLVRVSENDQLLVFDSDGVNLFEDTFESNVSAIAIAPDGDHVALSTAFPDNAVHLYQTRNGRYLGRTENRTTSVLGDLRFGNHKGRSVIETYDIGPGSDLDVHENRTRVIDRIPLTPQIDVQSLSGVCIVNSEEDGEFHFIPNSELTRIQGALRIPDVQVNSACGCSIAPVDAAVIFHEPKEAIESQFDFCLECRSAAAVYPDSKTEKTRP